ncbi:Uncharacterised protein [Bordetella pertussis]|nr:Uncharacterised protein [Bordetella pertussis]
MPSGCARRCSARPASTSSSQSPSSDWGRALSAGNDPMTPLTHCAIASLGLETINMGEQTTGRVMLAYSSATTGWGMAVSRAFMWGDSSC